MSISYDPANWYWKSNDGQIYSSKAAKVISDDDPEFAKWAEQGGIPTVWPKDDSGAQTQEALDKVLAPQSAPVITYKADLWRRCTDEEAEKIEKALAEAPVRQRRLFESALYLDHSDEAFAFAESALKGLFSKKRAGELLAAS